MQQNKEYLKERFVSGAKPTQRDFHDWLDSYMHKDELDAALERLEAISLDPAQAWRVDNELDAGSVQPVQNKVVTAKIAELLADLADVDADVSSASATLSALATTVAGKVDMATHNTLASAVAALQSAVAGKAAQADVTALQQRVTAVESGKVAVQQGAAHAGKVLAVGADGNVVPSKASSDGNTINVGKPVGGYHTLTTAIAAVAEDKRKPGLCVTWMAASGLWDSRQFCGGDAGNWSDETLWEEYGKGGSLEGLQVNGIDAVPGADGKVNIETVSGVKVNGVALGKDSAGVVNIAIDSMEVDETLNGDSTNPVSNAAVAAGIEELRGYAVTGAEVEPVEGADGVGYDLVLTRQYGDDLRVSLPAGSGGGGGGVSSRIVLKASLSETLVKVGSAVTLNYQYDHVNSDNESDGVRADLLITIKKGSTNIMQRTVNNVAAGYYTLDISEYLQEGTIDVYVRATCAVSDESTGETTQQTKQAYCNVQVLDLQLTTSFDLAGSFANGGYLSGETIVVPFAVTGSGSKTVTLYVDGAQTDSKVVTKSGTTNGEFRVEANGLTAGRHNVQLVAETSGVRSQSIWIDILRAGSTQPYIGILFSDERGAIMSNPLSGDPVLEVEQYETLEFEYSAYRSDSLTCEVQELSGEVVVSSMTVGRRSQRYSSRYNEAGLLGRRLVCGATEYPFTINVAGSALDVGEATGSLELKLDANGRSNHESRPDVWVSGGVQTTFNKVLWNDVSGWDGTSLVLRNGASATVGFAPFVSDPGATGMTVELEFRLNNVTARDGEVFTCHDGYRGIRITTDKMGYYTGSSKNITDTDTGAVIQVPAGVEYTVASGRWIKASFVIGRRGGNKLLELYLNGVRSAADEYASGDLLLQSDALQMAFSSEHADVEVRNMRVYRRALSDDEALGNFIADRLTGNEIMSLYEENDILEGDVVSMEKLRAKGKGVLRVVRTGGLAELNATNDKKAKFYGDIYYFSPFGREYDFLARNALVQIQGTSSTKYPAKNYRIIFTADTILYVGEEAHKEMAVPGSGVSEAAKGNTGNLYAMRPGATPINIFCMKKDYSDPSMATNTGFAKLMNDVLKEMGSLTPPQVVDPNKRTAIDGFPISIFSSESSDGEAEYYGQYNFNNEKKDSGEVYGFNAIYGDDGEELLGASLCCLEFLNNSQPLCNFQADDDLDAQLDAEFDDALEFRYPENDTSWNPDTADGEVAPTATQEAAIKRLFEWIRDCKPAGARIATRLEEAAGQDYVHTWESAKFKAEYEQYFDRTNMLAWYLHTDYNMSVDQRAKNMMLYSHDGIKWYFFYYDGDSMLKKRNDIYLAYNYLIDRTTWDVERNKYAFEGHDSWLWNLVLANLGDDLCQVADVFRSHLTKERVLTMLLEEQSGNYSAREFNKSGYFAYIQPQLEGVLTQGELKKYPFMYGLNGDREMGFRDTIEKRYALLDAKYSTSVYMSDNIDTYFAMAAGATSLVKVVSDEVYYYGYGTNNAQRLLVGLKGDGGDEVEIPIAGPLYANDPVRIYGASRMSAIDLCGAAGYMTGQWNFGKCVRLRVLNMGMASPVGGTWYMSVVGCSILEEIDVTLQLGASTASGSSVLDLGTQRKLRVLRAGGTQVSSITLAEGAPVETLVVPHTLTQLRLVDLPSLTMEGLSMQKWDSAGGVLETLENYPNVASLVLRGCPGMEWQTIVARCTALQRVRVEVGTVEGDGHDLETIYHRNLQGLDADGNAVDYCALTGVYRLTRFIDEGIKAAFPELEILDPEYTMIEMDDTISDDANGSNLDNGTGYKYGTDYVASGHITKLLAQRHRVLCKMTGEKEATIYPLHDEDSAFYADAASTASATAAALDGSEGDVMMYEPGRWYKGINDPLNGKKYTCISSRDAEHMPSVPDVDVLTWDDLLAMGAVTQNKKLLYGYETLATSYSNDSAYAVVHVVVEGYKLVRFPTTNGANMIVNLAIGSDGAIAETVAVDALAGGFENGMYVIYEIPAGVTDLYFTVQKSAAFDSVVLSKGTKIEDMEPDWVWAPEWLCAVAETSVSNNKMRSIMVAQPGQANMDWTMFHSYSQRRGMQQIDYEMSKDTAQLFMARYGRRDGQEQCGAGSSAHRNQNATVHLGMTDTLKSDNSSSGACMYYKLNADGERVKKYIGSPNVLGYQDWQGSRYEMIDGATVNGLINSAGNVVTSITDDDGNTIATAVVDGQWTILMPDGSQRKVKGSTSSGMWIKAVVHGKYCDIVPAGNIGGSSSTFFGDIFYYSASTGRVVFRSSFYASAEGGIVNAYASYGVTIAHTFVGSRLAFRGTIVWAVSVEAFKAITEVS